MVVVMPTTPTARTLRSASFRPAASAGRPGGILAVLARLASAPAA
jgi:hypothetical protein